MRILLIEDEGGIAGFIQQGLMEEGYTVDVADEGNKGLNLSLTGNYDLLLVDWMLPGKNGPEIVRAVRESGIQTPIIFLTAKDSSKDVVAGLDIGANDYIRKPFSFDELLSRIRVQLRPRGEFNAILKTGWITMDISQHKVFRHDKEVVLTPREFGLLEYLMKNKGKACSRQKIIEQVWDIHFDYDTSVIDVYINFLRKKIDEAGRPSLIQTIRGMGYMVNDD